MLLQRIDGEPMQPVVTKRPGGEANSLRHRISSSSDDAIDALIDFLLGLRVILVRRLRPNDVDQLHAFGSQRVGHPVGRLLLSIDFTAVSDDRTVKKIYRVIRGVVEMPQLLFVPGWLEKFVLKDFQEIGCFRKAGSRRRGCPTPGVMRGEVPAGRSTQ